MMSLFSTPPVFPEGFAYYPDFISEDEERKLLEHISSIDLQALIFQGFEAKRRVKSFGYDYHFDKRQISPGIPIPQGFDFLIEKVADFFSMQTSDLAEILVTEYPPGSVINWHRDAPPFDIVIGISLLSNCVFKLRPYDKALRTRKSTVSLDVLRRSVYILKGASRSDWEHSIAPVKETRYSVTLRTLRNSG